MREFYVAFRPLLVVLLTVFAVIGRALATEDGRPVVSKSNLSFDPADRTVIPLGSSFVAYVDASDDTGLDDDRAVVEIVRDGTSVGVFPLQNAGAGDSAGSTRYSYEIGLGNEEYQDGTLLNFGFNVYDLAGNHAQRTGFGILVLPCPSVARLCIRTSPNPSNPGEMVSVSGRFTDEDGNGLAGFNIAVEWSPNGVGGWSDFAGPFATQPGGRWWVEEGWRFSSVIFLRAVYSGDDLNPHLTSEPYRHDSGPYGVGTLPDRQYRGIFFYAWYGNPRGPDRGWEHWNECLDSDQPNSIPCEGDHSPPATWASNFIPDLKKGFHPKTELYDSLDTNIIKKQIRWIERTNVDFVLLSWWGKEHRSDLVLEKIITEVMPHAKSSLKWAIYYERDSLGNPSADEIKEDLDYVVGKYASTPYYFSILGKPVVFVFAKPEDNLGYVQRWADARQQLRQEGKDTFISLKVWETSTDSWRNYVNWVDSWHQFAPSTGFEHVKPFSAFVSPGFYRYHEAEPRLERDLGRFKSDLASLTSLPYDHAQFLLMQSWNEWHEGHQIEPGCRVIHNDNSGFTKAGECYGLDFVDAVGSAFASLVSAPNP
jgi:hypothetical protein